MGKHLMNLAASLALLCVCVCSVSRAHGDQAERIAAGSSLAQGVGKGNCLACHTMPSDPRAQTSANIGPPLIGMRARFPLRERLRRQVSDAGITNPDTVMPPFGRNQILTPEEIDLIVDYLYTL